jgi:hypothetical protein
MAVELLGGNLFPHVAIVCVLTYLVSGERSIYSAQRLLRSKRGVRFLGPTPLRDLQSHPPLPPAPPEVPASERP